MNQILISKKIYVTREMKRKKMIYKTLYILSIFTIIILLVYFVFAESMRNSQEALGKEILEQIDNTTVLDQTIVVALDEEYENDEEDESQIVQFDEAEIENETVKSKVSTSDGNQYDAEAVLSFPRLGITYPVLSDENDRLLKVSLCKYWGPSPNNVGNYCIVGHNYKSGKMFGKLSMAEIGDQVILSDLSGRKITYSIYNKFKVDPTDVSCTSQRTNGKREITLITCTNYGKERLVLKAREI
ncbi:MAG: sortase [Clostridia bacterium]|nr:sortase [Clostridia bacterium]